MCHKESFEEDYPLFSSNRSIYKYRVWAHLPKLFHKRLRLTEGDGPEKGKYPPLHLNNNFYKFYQDNMVCPPYMASSKQGLCIILLKMAQTHGNGFTWWKWLYMVKWATHQPGVSCINKVNHHCRQCQPCSGVNLGVLCSLNLLVRAMC